jgi:parallel beta-helix repeat protein
VRHGLFEKNILEDNGRFGISIGHKDSDNLLLRNTVRGNHQDGIHFRNEIEGHGGAFETAFSITSSRTMASERTPPVCAFEAKPAASYFAAT